MRSLYGLLEVHSQADLWHYLQVEQHLADLPTLLTQALSKAVMVSLVNEAIPTCLGLPLMLTLEGTAILQLNTNTQWHEHNAAPTLEQLNNIQLDSTLKLTYVMLLFNLNIEWIDHVVLINSFLDVTIVFVVLICYR